MCKELDTALQPPADFSALIMVFLIIFLLVCHIDIIIIVVRAAFKK